MSGFIGLNELFRKVEVGFNYYLSEDETRQLKKLLYPLSQKNSLTLKHEDFAQALEKFTIEKKIKDFLISYLVKHKKDML